jgi:Ca2+-binding RTX toxin-like protein
MPEDTHQKISQFIDSELNYLESFELLKAMHLTPEFRHKYNRYQTISHAMKADVFGLSKEDFTAAVSKKIQHEPTYLLPQAYSIKRNYRKMALVASIVAVVIIAGYKQQLYLPLALQMAKIDPLGAINGVVKADNDSYQISSIDTTNQGADNALSTVALINGEGQMQLNGLTATNFKGDALDNTIIGDLGDNLIDGAAGMDKMIGGGGNDIYIIDNNGDVIKENLNSGTDLIITKLSNYSLKKLSHIENITYEGKDNSVLEGNELNNMIIGGSGNDRLIGGLGDDSLRGDGGNDQFIFNARKGVDTIYNFVPGEDKLIFSRRVFRGLGSLIGTLNCTALNSGDFVNGQDSDDRIIYNTKTGRLYYDKDGSGPSPSVQIAVINPLKKTNISHSDIQVEA